jgi:hypothetical protein
MANIQGNWKAFRSQLPQKWFLANGKLEAESIQKVEDQVPRTVLNRLLPEGAQSVKCDTPQTDAAREDCSCALTRMCCQRSGGAATRYWKFPPGYFKYPVVTEGSGFFDWSSEYSINEMRTESG